MNQLTAVQDVDRSLAAASAEEPVGKVQRRFPEEFFAALCLQCHHIPQDGSHALFGNISVFLR